ncbi:hypothetical protein GA0115240_144891 [Streptomyces sp. DvalAA-14]|nr:hypothetical protein GA0115240_144891 [Streptomyces sp. DvalAA-14]
MGESGTTRPVFKGMTRDEVLSLPAAVDLETANRALGLGRSKGYELPSAASTRAAFCGWAIRTGW